MSDSKSQQRRNAIQRDDDASEPMTDERLREIEAREQAATKGPWEVYDLSIEHFYDTNHKLGIGSGSKGSLIYAVAKVEGMGPLSEGDAAFIAHARQDVPDLVAALRHFTALPPEVAAAMERITNPNLRQLHEDQWKVVQHFTTLFTKGNQP